MDELKDFYLYLCLSFAVLTACSNTHYEQRDLDEPSTAIVPSYLYSNSKTTWTSQFVNKELKTLDNTATYKIEAVLAPVQKPKTQIKDGYSFSMSIEGVVIQ